MKKLNYPPPRWSPYLPLLVVVPILLAALIGRQIHKPPGPIFADARALFPLDLVVFVIGWWLYSLCFGGIRSLFLCLQGESPEARRYLIQVRTTLFAAAPLIVVAAFLRSADYLLPLSSLAGSPVLFYTKVVIHAVLFLGAWLLEAARYAALLANFAVPFGRAVVAWFVPTGVLLILFALLQLF